jgi:hypothetical protein
VVEAKLLEQKNLGRGEHADASRVPALAPSSRIPGAFSARSCNERGGFAAFLQIF